MRGATERGLPAPGKTSSPSRFLGKDATGFARRFICRNCSIPSLHVQVLQNPLARQSSRRTPGESEVVYYHWLAQILEVGASLWNSTCVARVEA